MAWIESGDPRWPVWLVGEAPGADEVAQGRPFIGQSGRELDRMLLEAGWPQPERMFRTNVCHIQPPPYKDRHGRTVTNDIGQFFASRKEGLPPLSGRFPREPVLAGLERLVGLARLHRPQLIVALGGTALWGLTGLEGITKWRGSVLEALPDQGGGKVIPTFHPADILRQWTHRPIAVTDLRRAKAESTYPEIRKPAWDFVVAPSLADVRNWLSPHIGVGSPLVCDTEGWGVVDCIGFASSSTDALCIPFVHETGEPGRSYWSPQDEAVVLELCTKALVSCPQTFHNATWDLQVLGKQWGVRPWLQDDTMVAQHVAFPGLLGGRIDPTTGRVDKKGSSLSLSFIASMYCDYYRFWKDDGRLFDPAIDDERDYWAYNCEDCVRTRECRDVLRDILARAGLISQYEHEMQLFPPVLDMMFRGLRLDPSRVKAMRAQVRQTEAAEQHWLDTALGWHLNTRSTPQMRALFYDDLGVAPIKDRRTGNPTLDDDALEAIAAKQPLLIPLVRKIQNIRSLGVADNNFLAAMSSAGPRLRTQLNIAGVETFRFSSSETAFGEGMNCQNLARPIDE